MKKISDKLDKHYEYNTSLKTQFMKYVYDCQNIDEFVRIWDVLISTYTYNLQEASWL